MTEEKPKDEKLLGRAQAWAQRVANARFAAWSQTKAGKKWKALKVKVSPYTCGFDPGEDVREMTAAIGGYDEEKMKGLLLEFPNGRGGANGL